LVGRLATSGANAFDLTTERVLISAAVVLAAALLGAAVTLRRVLRIDPAAAIGSAT
jgi:ABC-type antimicrobial peptide transport system permease subunit